MRWVHTVTYWAREQLAAYAGDYNVARYWSEMRERL